MNTILRMLIIVWFTGCASVKVDETNIHVHWRNFSYFYSGGRFDVASVLADESPRYAVFSGERALSLMASLRAEPHSLNDEQLLLLKNTVHFFISDSAGSRGNVIIISDGCHILDKTTRKTYRFSNSVAESLFSQKDYHDRRICRFDPQ